MSEQDYLRKPEWINKYKLTKFIQAILLVLGQILFAIGGVLFFWWSDEFPLWKRLLGMFVVLTLCLILAIVLVWYAYFRTVL
jgi:hypothetical protein